MASRVRAIHPDCEVIAIREYLVQSNAERILSGGFDFLFDAIDSPREKCLLIALCRERDLPIITAGGAGGRRDPTCVRVADLARSEGDRLLQAVRKTLRADYGFPRGARKFGVECVFSDEPPVYPRQDGTVCGTRESTADLRLDCRSGFGTATFVTGTFGFVAAARIVQRLAQPAA